MTGVGPTASAVTVQWTKGILDNTNTSIDSATNDRRSTSPSSPLSFMYSDFKNLQVTVSQTLDIEHQGITVSWTGGLPTEQVGTIQAGFLQMMECWGDATTGPTPEQCEYGSPGLLPSTASNGGIALRSGPLCPTGAVPSVTSPPRAADGSGPADGCDTQERSDPSHLAPCPTSNPSCTQTDFTIPFAAVSDPTHPLYNPGTTYYSAFNTDEIQEAVTASDGTGQQQFETLTGTQAPGLGCGQAESNGQPRGCWLVIVPRGQYEPNGYQIVSGNTNSFLATPPLSASNWAQRIQVHLGFAPVGSFCPPGTLERQTFGTQLAARAMQSWQLSLNQAANCAKVYGYSAVPEATNTLNLTAGGDSGLAFTTIPIGSEATRSGGSPPSNLPTVLYAPVAIAALDFGFSINYRGSGYVTTPVKLTPLLLAKAVTQSYLQDLPDFFPDYGKTGPAWAQSNPLNISEDPQFHTLNPAVPQDTTGPIAPLLTEDHSAANQQVWQWIQADSTASGWLAGTKDTTDGNLAVDPDYQALKLGTPPALDSYPRAYSACLDLGKSSDTPPKEMTRCTLDLIPYAENFDSAASAVLTANNPDESGPWNTTTTAPDGSLGWWQKAGVEALGQIFMWAASDTPDLAAYGLIPAELCDNSGGTCVGPSTASVTAAVGAATADSSGLLHVDPAHPGTGGYPLTQIIYAAVATNQSAAALSDYADLIAYAAGTGQTIGAAPGDLPPGYLPLPANLQAQAQSVVTKLRGLASPSPSPSPSSSTSSSSGSSSSQSPAGTATTASGTTTTASGTTTGGTGTAAGAGSVVAGATPTPSTVPAFASVPAPVSSLAKLPVAGSTHPVVAQGVSTSPGGAIGNLPPAQAAAGATPQEPVGSIRWALIGVAIAGAAFAGGGTLLRNGGTVTWRRRRLE